MTPVLATHSSVVSLPAEWAIESVFGGWIAATLAREAVAACEVERIVASASITFLRPVPVGDARVDITVAQEGRSYAFVVCELVVADRIAVIARFGLVPPDRIPALADEIVTPGLPPESRKPTGRTAEVAHRVDWRAETAWSERVDGAAPFTAWIRPRPGLAGLGVPVPGGHLDPGWYLIAADLIGPAAFSRTRGPVSVATVTLEVEVVARTGSPWLRQVVTARPAGERDVVGSLTLTTPSGRVVAVTTQRAVLTPVGAEALPFSVTGFGYGMPA